MSDYKLMSGPIMHHAGWWLRRDDVENAIHFFQRFLNFHELARNPRKGGGERIFLGNTANQYIEILVSDDIVDQREVEAHPIGRVRGAPHLCFVIPNARKMKDQLRDAGFDVVREAPQNLDGWSMSEMGEHRILFVEGPAGVNIELFEFKKAAFPLIGQ